MAEAGYATATVLAVQLDERHHALEVIFGPVLPILILVRMVECRAGPGRRAA